MKCRCVINSGKNLPLGLQQEGFASSSGFFRLKIGEEYEILAVSVYRGFVSYLIFDEDSIPAFYPKECFDISDNHVPPTWKFSAFNQSDYMLEALFGYPFLIENENHYEAIVEGDDEARWIAKKELEKILKKRS